MALIRSFVAVELPEAVRAALTRLQEEVKTGGGRVKWVQPRGVHLTLKFLGYVDEAKAPALVQALTRACEGFGPLEVALSGLGVFPSPSRPRVAWVGLSGGVEKLLRLQEGVEKVLSPFGFPREDRAFGEAFLKSSPESVSFKVEGISLMKSQLTPSGALYTRLASIPLHGPL